MRVDRYIAINSYGGLYGKGIRHNVMSPSVILNLLYVFISFYKNTSESSTSRVVSLRGEKRLQILLVVYGDILHYL